ncbi:MAG: UDP-2,3-diacylglucosamine diphosphatase LpxI [Proteobacteria bacterium]|nr:UDP-2,3-diacylglucosamine diphosphatase LpxI [Pseudomonadota bacterium]
MAVIGLIAGSGPLPLEVATAVRERGRGLSVAAIEDNADPSLEGVSGATVAWFNAGQLDALIGFLREAGAREVLLAGAVSKRRILRDPGALRPDARALALLARLSSGRARGDDAILRALAGELEDEGMRVVESTAYLEDRMTPEGRIAGPEPSPEVLADARLGLRVIESLGALDVGQAALVHDGVVLAVEAVEGTDETIRRGSRYGRGAVLVKAAKPGQDMRFDVPVIGPATLELAAECGLAAVALEASRTLILQRERSRAAAEREGVTLLGIRP